MNRIHPILFSTPMVQAILDGRKTMTRRMIKGTALDWLAPNMFSPTFVALPENNLGRYGYPGDILWVRERHQKLIDCETGKFHSWAYYADMPERYYDMLPCKFKPSIHMPKEACRLFLKVSNVRVERLHDITPGDAADEGIEYWNVDADALEGGELVADYKNYMWRDDEKHKDYYFPTYGDPISSFLSLWEKLNGEENLNANPWLWVISFERTEKPLNF